MSKPNARLIANAPAWLAELVDRVEAAEARVAELDEMLDEIIPKLDYAEIKGRKSERAAVVAWLRREDDRDLLNCYCYRAAADGVEASAHLPPSSGQHTGRKGCAND